jgi:hypothetical protein
VNGSSPYRNIATEHALIALVRTFREGWSSGVPSAYRRVGRRIGMVGVLFPSENEFHRHSKYLRMVSIVEACLDTVGSSLLREDYPSAPDLYRKLIDEAEVTSSRGWPDRRKAFKHYHGIDLSTVPRHGDLDGVSDVRNAIAHGLGVLTPRQRTASVRRRIESVDVPVRDNRVIVADNSISFCYEFSREFIIGFDKNL